MISIKAMISWWRSWRWFFAVAIISDHGKHFMIMTRIYALFPMEMIIIDNFRIKGKWFTESFVIMSCTTKQWSVQVRFIDNFSTGSRGSKSAECFLSEGYAVIFLHRKGSLEPFQQVHTNIRTSVCQRSRHVEKMCCPQDSCTFPSFPTQMHLSASQMCAWTSKMFTWLPASSLSSLFCSVLMSHAYWNSLYPSLSYLMQCPIVRDFLCSWIFCLMHVCHAQRLFLSPSFPLLVGGKDKCVGSCSVYFHMWFGMLVEILLCVNLTCIHIFRLSCPAYQV